MRQSRLARNAGRAIRLIAAVAMLAVAFWNSYRPQAQVTSEDKESFGEHATEPAVEGMVVIPGGWFKMGSEKGEPDERPGTCQQL